MQGLSLPAAQTIPNYALLSAVYGALQLLQRQKPRNGMGGYAAVAFLDVEANFLVVSSLCSFPDFELASWIPTIVNSSEDMTLSIN